jgi:hypothetical protein
VVHLGVALFAVGSPIAAEYEETCRRLGIAIVAAVRNRPGPVYVGVPVVDVASIRAGDVAARWIVPLFTPRNRATAVAEARDLGLAFADALIDPTAIVASSCTAGHGTFVNAGCVIGAHAELGEHVVINRAASIGHDVTIGAYGSVGPGAVIAGNVTIERGATVGAGAVVLPTVRVGEDAIVGAGAVAVDDVPAGSTVVGNPARPLAGPLERSRP